MLKNIAIIPARGGSKRIPKKNIKAFCGKPMIFWSINAARKSKCFDRIIVSTEDNKIAKTAQQFGAETPFIRPAHLADDFKGTSPVIRHAIEWLENSGERLARVCCIYATAPFLQPDDIRNGLALLNKENSDYVFSVSTYPFPIQRAIRITKTNRVKMLYPKNLEVRSQDLEETYHDAGQFYWGKTSAWLAEVPILGPNSAPIVLPAHRVQDIDTPEDWKRAELMFSSLRKVQQ